MNIRMREAIVVGPSGDPVLDIDPGDLPFDVDHGTVNEYNTTLAGMVFAIMDLDAESTMQGMHKLVWSDDQTPVMIRCPECNERVDGELFVIESEYSEDLVVCMGCVNRMDGEHPPVCGDPDCDRH